MWHSWAGEDLDKGPLMQFPIASGTTYSHTSKETMISSSMYFLTVLLQPSKPLLLTKVSYLQGGKYHSSIYT